MISPRRGEPKRRRPLKYKSWPFCPTHGCEMTVTCTESSVRYFRCPFILPDDTRCEETDSQARDPREFAAPEITPDS